MLLAVPEADPYPRGLIEQLTAMGLTVHMSLDKSKELVGLKQLVGNVGGLAVITYPELHVQPPEALRSGCWISSAAWWAAFSPASFTFSWHLPSKESPGPVFLPRPGWARMESNSKFISSAACIWMRKRARAELMSQNRIQGGMMFKMAFDPRIIGNRIDENGNQVTGIGEFIRKYSLDEFPQFFNVLKGDMSLVGTVHLPWTSSRSTSTITVPAWPSGRVSPVCGRSMAAATFGISKKLYDWTRSTSITGALEWTLRSCSKPCWPL